MTRSILLKTQPVLLCILFLQIINLTAFAKNAGTSHLHVATQTLNDCEVKASFTPFGDTSFSIPFNQVFTNNSTNATSFSWIINGIRYFDHPENLSLFLDVGINEIKIVARNGKCTDTAVSYFFCSGIPSDNSKFFLGNYGIPGFENKPTSFDGFKEGGFLIGGYTFIRDRGTEKGMVMKIQESGCIEWTRSIENVTGRVTTVKTANDGGLVASGLTGYFQHYFIRFDKSGNVLWQKNYDWGEDFSNIKLIYELQDGSWIITSTSPYFKGFFIAKISSNGTMMWKKNYSYNDLNSIPFGIVQNSGNLYISGYLRMPNQEDNYLYRNHDAFILNIDHTSGTTVWTKNYGGKNRSDFFWDIHPFGENLIVNSIKSDYTGKPHGLQGYHVIDKNGIPVKSSSLLINNDSSYSITRSQILPIDNSKLYIFNHTTLPLSLQPYYALYSNFLEVDTSQNILWNKSYYRNNRNIFTMAVKGKDNSIAALGTTTSLLHNGGYLTSENYLLTRIERGWNPGNYFCNFGESNFSLVSDTIAQESFTWSKDSLSFPVTRNIQNQVNSYYGQVRFECPDYIDSCSFLALNGPSEICNLSDTLTYRVHKNISCSQPVQWDFPQNASVLQKNDTILKIKLSSFGNFKVSALLARSCTPVKDSIFLTAAPLLMKLDLGRDTTLCAGNSLKLQAGPFFVKYQWQDSSSDSSFIVKQEGIYWVKVEDSCGNIAIDSIIVTIKNSIPIKGIQDQTICKGDSIKLVAEDGFINYSWTPDYRISLITSRTPTVEPITNTTYYLKAEKSPGCFAFDTVSIKVNSPQSINLGKDTSFCKGDSVLLDAGEGFQEYLWNNGSKNSILSVNQSGIYYVKAWDINTCLTTDTLQILSVFNLPVVQLNKDSVLCKDEVRLLDAGNVNSFYKWNTGNETQKIQVNKVGKYSVNVRDQNGCVGVDSMFISEIRSFPSNFLTQDTVLCQYSSLTLSPLNNYNSYLWNTGSMAKNITISQPGTYWLQVTDAFKCEGTDSIKISPKECLSGVFIPNAFSPNNDGKNDIFKPMVFGNVSLYRFSIYNRWGEKIFVTTDPLKGWDGKIQSIPIQSSSFVWMCQYKLEGEETKVEKGTVNLIR